VLTLLTTSDALKAASLDLVLSPTVGVKEELLLAEGIKREGVPICLGLGGGLFLFFDVQEAQDTLQNCNSPPLLKM
jgi:hypothetical protein